MPRRANPLIDDVADASDTGSITDEASGDGGHDDDISNLFDDLPEIEPLSPELSARASAEEAMRRRDEAEAPTSGIRRLNRLLRPDRGKSPVRVGSTSTMSRSRTRSPITPGSELTNPSTRPTATARTAGKHLNERCK